jgi:hypothetical protein
VESSYPITVGAGGSAGWRNTRYSWKLEVQIQFSHLLHQLVEEEVEHRGNTPDMACWFTRWIWCRRWKHVTCNSRYRKYSSYKSSSRKPGEQEMVLLY